MGRPRPPRPWKEQDSQLASGDSNLGNKQLRLGHYDTISIHSEDQARDHWAKVFGLSNNLYIICCKIKNKIKKGKKPSQNVEHEHSLWEPLTIFLFADA